jgi:hypothetical protein
VDGFCLSSCANYWATAAAELVLREGLIGMHGNITNCVDIFGGFSKFVAAGLPPPASRKQFEKVADGVQKAIDMEASFYNQKNSKYHIVPNQPVDYCKPDKGFKTGHIYSFIAPNEQALIKLGIQLQNGSTQSQNRISEYNNHYKEKIIYN